MSSWFLKTWIRQQQKKILEARQYGIRFYSSYNSFRRIYGDRDKLDGKLKALRSALSKVKIPKYDNWNNLSEREKHAIKAAQRRKASLQGQILSIQGKIGGIDSAVNDYLARVYKPYLDALKKMSDLQKQLRQQQAAERLAKANDIRVLRRRYRTCRYKRDTPGAIKTAKQMLPQLQGLEKMIFLKFIIDNEMPRGRDVSDYVARFLDEAVYHPNDSMVRQTRTKYIPYYFAKAPDAQVKGFGRFFGHLHPIIPEAQRDAVIRQVLKRYLARKRKTLSLYRDVKSFIYAPQVKVPVTFDRKQAAFAYNKDFLGDMKASVETLRRENAIATIFYRFRKERGKLVNGRHTNDKDGDLIPDDLEEYFGTRKGKKDDLGRIDVLAKLANFEIYATRLQIKKVLHQKDRKKMYELVAYLSTKIKDKKTIAKYRRKLFSLCARTILKSKNHISRYRIRPRYDDTHEMITPTLLRNAKVRKFSCWFDRDARGRAVLTFTKNFGKDEAETVYSLKRADWRAYLYVKLKRMWGKSERELGKDLNGDGRISTTVTRGDRDGDWLPDKLEDLNGNRRLDKGETDPYNPDSNGDGIPDVEQVDINKLLRKARR